MGDSDQASNPFDELIAECHNDPRQIQARYEAHRFNRSKQQKDKLLDPSFPGWQVDDILRCLHEQAKNERPGAAAAAPFVDHRHSLTILARPPQHIRNLIKEIQQEIEDVAPSLWFTPPNYLHMTALEVASCRTEPEIDGLVAQLKGSGIIPQLVNYTYYHRTRLFRPVISYDATAMALSFIPEADDGTENVRQQEYHDDEYTYHHLRRDVSAQVAAIGLPMKPRYIAPSAHVTIARFITREGFLTEAPGSGGEGKFDDNRVAALINKIEAINEKLRAEYWPREQEPVPWKGEWLVGQERGLEICTGSSFYGGGECASFGKGFS